MPLKSFQPDLQVTVGTKTVKTYEYHAVILANYSEYVDTMLSVPMKEQKTRELTFAEIEPEVWEKMISYLEPGGSRGLTNEKMLEVIGYYDKYQFKSGLALFDTTIIEDLEYQKKRWGVHYGCEIGMLSYWDEYVKLAIATNGTGMKCEEILKWFASEFLQTNIPYDKVQDGFKQELFEDLLPVVSNDRKVLEFMVISVLGRKPMKTYSMEELQSIVSEDGFLDSLKTRCQILHDQKEALKALNIEKVYMNHPYDLDSDNGRLFRGPSKKNSVDKKMKLGVMSRRFYYHYRSNYDDHPPSNAILYSTDPYGSKWVISKYDDMEGEFGQLINEVCLFSWHGHGYTSLVPPKTGWRVYVDEGEEDSNVPINREILLSYEFEPAKREW